MEIPVNVFDGKRKDLALHTDLSPEGLPVEAESGARILGQLQSLAAISIREKSKAVISNGLCQDHAHAWASVCGRRCQCRCIGIVQLASLGLFHPWIEQRKRIMALDFIRAPGPIVATRRKAEALRRLDFRLSFAIHEE